MDSPYVPPSLAFVIGFCSGAASGARSASLRFLAENAHRKPASVRGWYLYRKTKNHVVLLRSLRAGCKTGAVLGVCAASFLFLDAGINRMMRVFSDAPPYSVSSTLSGTLLAGVLRRKFINTQRHSSIMAAGAGLGLAYGVAQDLRAYRRRNESNVQDQ